MSAIAIELLTAAEYAQRPNDGRLTELVRGRIVNVNMPAPRHGYVCGKTVRFVGNFADEHDSGRVMCNDSGVVTERNPDTVRGADVGYYSYQRLPRGPLPEGYLEVAPEVIFEVRSPGDRWLEIHSKVGEFHKAGVNVVCVLDDPTETAHVFYADKPPQILKGDAELTFPEVFGDAFRVAVRKFFE